MNGRRLDRRSWRDPVLY